jgi:NADH dehydrogenase [ubiquinone] 1 alpha subcomplex assembly factor 1
MTCIDFSDPQELAGWSAINDTVMGGRSQSQLHFDPAGHAVFSGSVSFENNGGFASVRRQPGNLGMARAAACILEVRGDGKRYKLSMRTDDGFDGISYQCGFHPPAGVWTTCRLPFSQFLPTWRGRVLLDQPAFDSTRLRQFGLLIAERQEGDFSLALRTIGFEITTP